MKFKNTKKPTPKKPTQPAQKSSVKKEEIKEIIEETVEEVLKEEGEKKLKVPQENQQEDQSLKDGEKDQTPSEYEEAMPATKSVDTVVLPDTREKSESQDAEQQTPQEEVSAEEKNTPEDNKQPTPAVPQTTAQASDTPSDKTEQTTPVVSVSGFSNTPEQSAFTGSPEKDSPKKSHLMGILIALIAFILAAGGGFWYLSTHNVMSTFTKLPAFVPGFKPSPTSMPSPTATPTPKQVNVSMYKVTVLNGSGIAGEAAKVKTLLSGNGFSVESTGNATASDYVQTVISAKASVNQDALNQLVKTLSEQYTVSAHPVTLSDSNAADIIVTVGSGTK